MLRRWGFRLVPSERSLEAVGESVRLHIISRSKAFDLFPRTYKGKNRCVLRQKYALINSRERTLKSDINLEQSSHVETVVKLSLKKDTPKIEVTMEPDEESNYTPEEKATYQKIKDYVKDKYGVNVHTSYIAQVKRMCGLDMGENYNKSKKENPEVKQCPQEKVEYIKDALRYFGLV